MAAGTIPTGPRTIFRSGDLSRTALAKGQRDGRFVKIAKGIYSADTVSPGEAIVAANLWDVIAAYCPDAIVVDRTAARGGRVDGGVVTIASDARTTNFILPGVHVLVRPRVSHVSDLTWPADLHIATPARALVDNLVESRGRGSRPGRTLTRAELQDWVAQKRLSRDERRFRQLERDALNLAADLGQDPDIVRELFATVAGEDVAGSLRGPLARAALRGTAWDTRRLGMFASCARQLAGVDAPMLPAPERDGELPFYEAYFSNYIEGTEFTIPQAREIVETQTPPAKRAPDGHDLLGTHRCVVDPIGRAASTEEPEQAIDLLRTRHRTLMAGRPDVGPGVFKDAPNRAGNTEFVHPDMVHGTLVRGLERAPELPAGLPRAVYVMVVVAEVHPFADGNGRAARLMMNAELSVVDQCRIVVPTVLRNDYIAALRRFSNGDGDVTALLEVLELAWRWTAAMPWGDRAATDGQMEATNATLEPVDAERTGRHLRLP